jgi:hypothetical protein
MPFQPSTDRDTNLLTSFYRQVLKVNALPSICDSTPKLKLLTRSETPTEMLITVPQNCFIGWPIHSLQTPLKLRLVPSWLCPYYFPTFISLQFVSKEPHSKGPYWKFYEPIREAISALLVSQSCMKSIPIVFCYNIKKTCYFHNTNGKDT